MSFRKRYLQTAIEKDLDKKMVFLSGARQTGKTTFAESLPLFFLECKISEKDAGKGLRYIHSRFPDAEAVQISLHGTKDHVNREGIRFCPAITFLNSLI